MEKLLKKEISKIIDVKNKRLAKFILKYGVIKAVFIAFIICFLFILIAPSSMEFMDNFINVIIRLGIAAIAGIAFGIGDYNMYKDVIEGKERFTINSFWYIVIEGCLGWGVICASCNITFVPFSMGSLIAGLVSLPFYGGILGIVQKKMFNVKLIKQINEEYIKGKNITGVKLKKKKKA